MHRVSTVVTPRVIRAGVADLEGRGCHENSAGLLWLFDGGSEAGGSEAGGSVGGGSIGL